MISPQEKLFENKRIIYLSLLVLVLSLLACHAVIAYYCRYTADDYSYMYLVREKGVLRFPAYLYMHHEGCFANWIYQGILVKSMLLTNKPFIFLVSFLILGIFCFEGAFRALFNRFLGGSDWINSLFLSVLIISAFYMTTRGLGETMYWCFAGIYFVYTALFLYALFAFLTTKVKAHQYLCYFAFFLFSMSRLNYAFVAISLFGLLLIHDLISQRKWNHKFAIAFLVLGAGILIYLIAPGNYVRRGDTHMPDLYTFMHNTVKAFAHFFMAKSNKIPIFLLFLLPTYFIGKKLSEPVISAYKNKTNAVIIHLKIGLLFLILLVIHSSIMSIANGAGSSDRTIVLMDFLFILFVGSIGFHSGSFYPKLLKSNFLLPSLSLVLSFLILYRLYIHKDSMLKEAAADDNRTEIIKAALETTKHSPIDTLFLNSLPNCVFMYNWDITKLSKNSDTAFWWVGLNNGLRLYYNAPFKIDSKEKSAAQH